MGVGSEGELRGELERAAGLLAPAVDWTQRVDALLRLESLAKGGASSFHAFPELLLGLLREPLAAQVWLQPCAWSRVGGLGTMSKHTAGTECRFWDCVGTMWCTRPR